MYIMQNLEPLYLSAEAAIAYGTDVLNLLTKKVGAAKTFVKKEVSIVKSKIVDKVKQWDDLVTKYSEMYGVPKDLIFAVIHQESAGDPSAMPPIDPKTGKRPSQAKGLMQIVPSTQASLGFSNSNMFDPDSSIHAGTKLLKQLMDSSNGNKEQAILGYWGGQGWAAKYTSAQQSGDRAEMDRLILRKVENDPSRLDEGRSYVPGVLSKLALY